MYERLYVRLTQKFVVLVFHEYGPQCAVTTVDIQTPYIVQLHTADSTLPPFPLIKGVCPSMKGVWGELSVLFLKLVCCLFSFMLWKDGKQSRSITSVK